MEFNYSFTHKPIRYKYISQEDCILFKKRTQNNVEAIIQVTCKPDRNSSPYYTVELLNYKQSNHNGFYYWVNQLHTLRRRVDFYLDESFQMGKILNVSFIQKKFEAMKPILLSTNRSKKETRGLLSGVGTLLSNSHEFAHSLRFTHPYLLLFSGTFGKELRPNKPVEGYREIPNFLHLRNLPIITDENLGDGDEQFQEIMVEGKLDRENFDQEKLTQFIQLLKNRPRVPTQLNLNYNERYQINKETNWPELSMCMSLASVTGSIYRKEHSYLKRIES